VSRHAQDRSYLRIPGTINNKRKIRGVRIVVAPQFLLNGQPIIESEAMLAPPFFKNLVRAFSTTVLLNKAHFKIKR